MRPVIRFVAGGLRIHRAMWTLRGLSLGGVEGSAPDVQVVLVSRENEGQQVRVEGEKRADRVRREAQRGVEARQARTQRRVRYLNMIN